MSSIDQRIVEMQFKNSEFESGIKQSLKSLDKLKKGLNFDDSSKSMDKLQKAGNSFSLASMAQNVESIANKFTMLGRIGMKAMDDIASYAYSTGKRLVKSLSVDQVTAGWTKYGEKTSSVQTIMNATGDSIDTVNGYLDKLMWFSDETSYNFTEMTAALGTLTSSGGEVKKLIPMIEGMATATAFAGKTSSEFSRVIYNLNQSYSQGYLSLMDWKSVELAQVGSEQLKQTLIDTAVELGTLKKASDGTYKTLKGTLVTAGNMGSTLNEKWATREVMEGGFGKFASVMEEAYKLVEAGEFDTASDAIASLEGKFDDIYFKAAKAAQEAKSFGEAIEATKDAVSSGWMKSFELIFGNYEEAKEMWTDLANALWNVFASGGEARNEMLQAWHDAGGRADLLQGIYDALEGLWGIVLAVKDAFADIFPPVTVDTLLKMSSAVKEFGANLKYLLRYREIVTGMEDVTLETPKEELEEFNAELKKGAKGDDVKKLQERLTKLGYDVGPAGTDGIFGPKTLEALKKFQEDYGLTVDGIYNSDVHSKLGEALGSSGIGEQLKKSAVYTLVFGDALKRVQRIAKGFFAVIKIGWNALKFLWNIVKVIADALSPLADVFLTLGAALGDWFVNLQKSMEQSEWFAKALDKVKNFFAPLKNWVTKAGESILNFFGLGKEADKTTGKMKTFNEWWTRIRDNVKNSKVWGNIKLALEKLKEAFTKMIAPIKEWWKNLRGGDKDDGEPTFLEKTAEKIPLILEKIGNAFAKFLAWITPFVQRIPEYAGKIKDFFKSVFESLKNSQFFGPLVDKIKTIFTSIWNAIKKWLGIGDEFDGVNEVVDKTIKIKDKIRDAFFGSKSNDKATDSEANKWELLISRLSGAWKKIKTFFSGAFKFADDFLYKLGGAGGITGYLIAALGVIGVKKFSGAIKSVFGLVELFMKAGTGLVDGLTGFVRELPGLLNSLNGMFTDVGKAAKKIAAAEMIKSLAILIGVLVASIWVLGTMDSAKLKRGAIALGGIMLVMTLLIAVTGMISRNRRSVKGIASMAGFFSGLALALGVMIAAIAILGSMKLETLAKGLGGLIVLLIILRTFMASMKGQTSNVSVALKGFFALALAIGVLAMVAKMIAKMSIKEMLKGFGGLILIMIMMQSFVKMAVKNNASTIKMTGFFGLAIAIGILAGVAKMLAKMEIGEMLKGFLALEILMLMIRGFMKSIAKNNASGAKLGGLIALAITLGVFVAAIAILGTMSTETLAKGVLGLVGVMFAIKMVVKAANGFDIKAGIGLLISCLGLIGVMLAFSSVLHNLKDVGVDKVLAFSAGMAMMMISLGITVRAAKRMKLTSALGLLLGMVGLIGMMVGLSYAMNRVKDIDAGKITAFCSGLSKAVLALSASMLILSLISPAGIAIGALALIAIVAAIGLIIAAFAGLSKIKGFNEFMGSGAAAIGNIIGSFQGAMEASRIDSLSKGLNSLSSSNVNQDKVNSALAAAQAVADFANGFPQMTIEESVATLIAGDTPFGLFCKNMETFATSISSLQVGLAGMTPELATKAQEAVDVAKPIADFANTFPEMTITQAIADAIAGNTPFGTFCNNMVSFGNAIVALDTGLANFNEDDSLQSKVNTALSVATPIAELANSFPHITIEQAIADAIAGGTPFSTFCDNMVSFGGAIVNLENGLKEFDEESSLQSKVNTALSVATPIAELANSFPHITIGQAIADAIAGGSPFEIFCTNMGAFATSVKTLETNLASISGTTIEQDTTTALNAAKQIASFASALNSEEYNIEANKGAIAAWFTGDTKANTVIDQIAELGEAIGGEEGLQAKISDLADTSIEADTTTLTAVLESIASALGSINANVNLDNGGVTDVNFQTKIETFLGQISQLGANISSFNSSIGDIDESKVIGVLNAVSKLGQAVAAVSGMEDTGNFDHMIESMKGLFSGGWTEGAGEGVDTSSITSVCEAMVAIVNGYKSQFTTAGMNFAAGLANGVAFKGYVAIARAKAVAKGMADAVKRTLDEHSPSKLTEEMGKYFSMGLGIGVEKYSNIAVQSSGTMAQSMLDAAKGGLSTLNSLITDNMDADPVVRPVIDLSDVQSGARTINGMFSNRPMLSAKVSADKAAATANSIAKAKDNQNGSKESNGDSAITNTDSSVNLSGNNFYVRSEQDIHSLASEIASLTRQQQRGLGAGY